MHRYTAVGFTAVALLVGCRESIDIQAPTAPHRTTDLVVLRAIGASGKPIQTLDDLLESVALADPTFAGIVIENGLPTVLLTDPT